MFIDFIEDIKKQRETFYLGGFSLFFYKKIYKKKRG